MAENIVRICRLCLNIIGDTNFELLESYRSGMLKTILVSTDISISLNPTICCKCADTLQKCFEFKMTCLSSEDTVKSYINISEPVKVKLEDVCYKELLKDDEGWNGQRICRLCFSLDSEFYTDVNDTLENESIRNMLNCCVPELNLDLTNDTLMCKECLYLLRKQFTFISDCLESEQKIKTFCNLKGKNSSNIIDLWSILQFYNKIKSENNIETVIIKSENTTCDIPEEVTLKAESNYDLKTEELYNPDDIEVKDEYSSEDEQGERGEEDNVSLPEYDGRQSIDPNIKSNEEPPPEKIKFPCDLCEYVTTRKAYLLRHAVVHRDIPVNEQPRCHLCGFRCRRKSYLKAHILRVHISSKGDPSRRFKCEKCNYKSKRRRELIDHMLRHTPENALHKCKDCTYVTNRYHSLQKHAEAKHKVMSEVKTIKCTECNFQSKWKSNLKKHFVAQHNPSKITYKCDKCYYSTSTFRNLKRHAKFHKEIENWFKS